MKTLAAETFKSESDYRAYTTKFDRVVAANDLDTILGEQSVRDRTSLDDAWHELQTGLLPWKTRLHVAASEQARLIREHLSADQREDTVITLLFDQSGSMRGQKILFSAATADVMQEHLGTMGIACEVLGFTTSRWKGGRSRQRWRWRFKPRGPGRLNDLLHIVYKAADDRRASTGGWSFRQMLRPDLTKENIDGEAIEWAVHRLLDLPQSRKLLIVLSDGAPVDDSTLLENGSTYLGDHLQHVIETILDAGEIELAALGVGYRAHTFYPISSHVEAPDELGHALLSLVTEMLGAPSQSSRSKATLP